MKYLATLFLTIFLTCTMQAQILEYTNPAQPSSKQNPFKINHKSGDKLLSGLYLSENFDSGIVPATFTQIDNDKKVPYYNNWAASPWIVLDIYGDGSKLAATSTSYYNPVGTADDWLITPQIDLGDAPLLYWDAMAFNNRNQNATRDGYEVYVSTTGNAIADFTEKVFSVDMETLDPTLHTVDLAAYANKKVYIAFRNNTDDRFILAIDNILVMKKSVTNAEMISNNLKKYYKVNSEVAISGKFKNWGSDPINSFDFNYSVNDGPAVTTNITGVNVASLGEGNIVHPTPYVPSKSGVDVVKMWLSNINGKADEVTDNDETTGSIVVYSNSANKKVLFEEFSTCKCGYCPDGHIVMDNITKNYPGKVNAVIHHSGYYTDAMTISEGEEYAKVFAAGAPTGSIDRVFIKQGRDVWNTLVASQKDEWTSGELTIDNSFNEQTREVKVKVNSKFVDIAEAGDIRLTVFVVEDNVTGTDAGYNQANYYNTTSGHPMYGRGNPIVGYNHRHVVRKVLTPVWGETGVVPSAPTINENYTKEYTFTLDAKYKEADIEIVAFLSYYNNDATKRAVINSEGTALNTSQGVNDITVTENALYPVPAKSYLNIIGEKYLNADYSVISMLGEKKLEGTNTTGTLDISSLPNGIYFIYFNREVMKFVKQ